VCQPSNKCCQYTGGMHGIRRFPNWCSGFALIKVNVRGLDQKAKELQSFFMLYLLNKLGCLFFSEAFIHLAVVSLSINVLSILHAKK
jgi:hypothetical protein